VLSTEHPLVDKLLEGSALKDNIARFAEKVKRQNISSDRTMLQEKRS